MQTHDTAHIYKNIALVSTIVTPTWIGNPTALNPLGNNGSTGGAHTSSRKRFYPRMLVCFLLKDANSNDYLVP